MILDLPHELILLAIRPPSLGRLCCTCKVLRRSHCIGELFQNACELWRSICSGMISEDILESLLERHPISMTQSWRDEFRLFLYQCAHAHKRKAHQRLEEGTRRVQGGYAQMFNQTCNATLQSVPLRGAALPGPAALRSKHAQLQHDHGQARQRLHALEAEVEQPVESAVLVATWLQLSWPSSRLP